MATLRLDRLLASGPAVELSSGRLLIWAAVEEAEGVKALLSVWGALCARADAERESLIPVFSASPSAVRRVALAASASCAGLPRTLAIPRSAPYAASR